MFLHLARLVESGCNAALIMWASTVFNILDILVFVFHFWPICSSVYKQNWLQCYWPAPNFELTTGKVFVHFVPIIRELAPFSSLPGASPFLPCFAPFLCCLPSMRCNVDENCLHLIGPFTAHKSSLHFDLQCTAFNAHPWFKCAKGEQHLCLEIYSKHPPLLGILFFKPFP